MFQLKIIHGILPTQYNSLRAGLTDSDKCPLCNLERQSLPHLLITCLESMNFWDLFTRWWQITFHQNIVLSEKVILYGWHQNCSSINFIALNYSLIIAKYHIFASNMRVGSFDFDSFPLRLKDKLGIIRTLAIKNNYSTNLKKRGLLCFSWLVSVLCACVCVFIASANVIITVLSHYVTI